MKTTHFCAICQKDTAHSLVIDKNKEIVVACPDCQHFVKYPALAADKLQELMGLHKAQNIGVKSAPTEAKPIDPAYIKSLIDAGIAQE